MQKPTEEQLKRGILRAYALCLAAAPDVQLEVFDDGVVYLSWNYASTGIADNVRGTAFDGDDTPYEKLFTLHLLLSSAMVDMGECLLAKAGF
jgi:hypothetical protein